MWGFCCGDLFPHLKLCGFFFCGVFFLDVRYIWLISFDYWLFVRKKILSKTAQGIFKISHCILFLNFDCCQLYWNVMDFCRMWIPFSFTCKKFLSKAFHKDIIQLHQFLTSDHHARFQIFFILSIFFLVLLS